MSQRPSILAFAGLLGAGVWGCGSQGAVTIDIVAPTYAPLNPITDRVSEYSVKRLDGVVLGVVSVGGSSPSLLALGAVAQDAAPVDLELSVLSGSELLGMARIRDVTFQNGMTEDYTAQVRKPILTVGSATPDEDTTGQLAPGQILDPTTSADMANPKVPDSNAPSLPAGTAAAAGTWDGQFLLAASATGITVIDTGSGKTVGVAPLGFTATRVTVGTARFHGGCARRGEQQRRASGPIRASPT